jgi:hypothetical protein
MGNISFDITKNVDLNKNVNLDIDKDVNANVVNQDILATAESDAEAFGTYALAETDAFTYVNEGEGTPPQVITNPGSIDALGNADDIIVGADGDDEGAAPDTLSLVFDAAGDPPPDVDDINGFGSLSSLTSPPPDTPDVPLPDPLLSISDLNLTEVPGSVSTTPGGNLQAEYSSDADFVVNFGERTLDLDGDGTETTDELLLTVPEGSTYLAQFLAGEEVEIEFESFAGGNGTFTFAGENYDVTNFVFDAESIQIVETGSGWDFQAASQFGSTIPGEPGDGESFSYSESTAALDLDGGGGAMNNGDMMGGGVMVETDL